LTPIQPNTDLNQNLTTLEFPDDSFIGLLNIENKNENNKNFKPIKDKEYIQYSKNTKKQMVQIKDDAIKNSSLYALDEYFFNTENQILITNERHN
jgi:hypothetical protein